MQQQKKTKLKKKQIKGHQDYTAITSKDTAEEAQQYIYKYIYIYICIAG